jgi:hypothetical protein
LPISHKIEAIDITFARLKPALDNGRTIEVERLLATLRPSPVAAALSAPVGMNSVGILADRLTILICKSWYLRHRQNQIAGADHVCSAQIPDIVGALAQCAPGHASLLEKVSSKKPEIFARSFQEAYYGLLSANILMWETQEMLYLYDMETVEPEMLRDYIRFFSHANMQRNAFISQSEQLYWADIV